MMHSFKYIFVILCICPVLAVEAEPENKFQLWKKPGYFRGFNSGYWSSHDDYAKKYKDLKALKNTGANLIKINIYGGTVSWKPPYKTKKQAVRWLHLMIKMARKAGLYYIIDVRAGPGRKDVSEEHISTTWSNKKERRKYAEMLKGYVNKYGNDPYFVGLNLMVEPNPLWKEIEDGKIETPRELKRALKKRKIDIHGMFAYFIREVRSVNKKLPLIVQNIQYSDPEWWELMEKYNDPYIVYDVHSYVPYEYSHAESKYSKRYPGYYWCLELDKYARYNKNLLNRVIFKHVKKFQKTRGVPVLLGEFGMEYPQYGGRKYLSDIVDIAKKEGWHFCLWNFRPNNPASKKYINFDPEKWGKEYWKEVLSWF